MAYDLEHIKLALSTFGLLGGIAASIGTYIHLKNSTKEMYYKDYEARKDFINNEKFSKIQAMIENENEKLVSLLAKHDGSQGDPYSKTSDSEEQILHQEIDEYINFLEAVSTLIKHKYIALDDNYGMWGYYIGRLYSWKPMWRYVSYPPYGWFLISAESQKAFERLQAKKEEFPQYFI